jgi:hypothetical protein
MPLRSRAAAGLPPSKTQGRRAAGAREGLTELLTIRVVVAHPLINVLSVSLEANLHAAILERPDLLDSPKFENALVELCTRYLTNAE